MTGMAEAKAAAAGYQPGVCNINQDEIKKRRNAGYLGSLIFVILIVIFEFLSVSRWYHLLLFFPTLLAGLGFLQAEQKFCVNYGSTGKQNASAGSKSASTVKDKASLAKDKAKANKINLEALAIAVVVALLTLLIPA
jgi:hypothetical protein